MRKVLLLVVTVLLLVSCEDDRRDIFEGRYEGIINCIGELERDNGDDFDIEITRTVGDNYELEIDNDFFLTAFRDRDELIVPVQSIIELFDLAFVSIDGTIRLLDDGNLNFDFFIVSDEGEATCITILFEN